MKKIIIFLLALTFLASCQGKEAVKDHTIEEVDSILSEYGYSYSSDDSNLILTRFHSGQTTNFASNKDGSIMMFQKDGFNYDWNADSGYYKGCLFGFENKKTVSGDCSEETINLLEETKKAYIKELESIGITQDDLNNYFQNKISESPTLKNILNNSGYPNDDGYYHGDIIFEEAEYSILFDLEAHEFNIAFYDGISTIYLDELVFLNGSCKFDGMNEKTFDGYECKPFDYDRISRMINIFLEFLKTINLSEEEFYKLLP